ncbi:GNAT family N-acetyltransferase, partial [Vibrio parahaemolyticus]
MGLTKDSSILPQTKEFRSRVEMDILSARKEDLAAVYALE